MIAVQIQKLYRIYKKNDKEEYPLGFEKLLKSKLKSFVFFIIS